MGLLQGFMQNLIDFEGKLNGGNRNKISERSAG